MDNIYINVERGRDGGVAVYEINGNSEQTLVFAGNVKDATEYFGGRCTKLASKPVEEADDRIVSWEPRRETETRRTGLSPRAIADRLQRIDEVTEA